MRVVDMAGTTLGMWKIVSRVEGTKKGARWLCVCTNGRAETTRIPRRLLDQIVGGVK